MTKSDRTPALQSAVCLLVVLLYFFRLTRHSLHVFFSSDDVTNLYRTWIPPVSRLVRANLLFFETSPFYRPMGAVWHRIIFHFAGFHPLPFHVVNLMILAANILLTYAVARRLSQSREVGALAALLGCYHPAFNSLAYDTGYIYDVLCYFFYFSTFALYLRIRQAGRLARGWEPAALCGLYICALNSKEMAVSLPLFLGLYEWMYHPPRSRSGRELAGWLWSNGRTMLITGAITLVFVVGRTLGADSLMLNAAYRPVLTWQRFMETSQQFVGELFFHYGWFTPARVLLVWGTLLAIALATRSKALRFAWLFLMLSAGPVAFIEPRSASQYYVVLFGWVLYAGVMLAGATRWLSRGLRGWAESARAPVVFAGVVLLLYPYYKGLGWSNSVGAAVDGEVVRAIDSQLHALHPAMPAAAHLLFRNEPDDALWQNLPGLVRMSYLDNGIEVDRLRRLNPAPSENALGAYDFVFDYQAGRLVEVIRPPDPRLRPALCMTAHGAEFYHADFSAVTAARPAAAGEMLILKATGLGITSPDVAPDQPFPANPLAAVMSRVEVKVNGRRTEVTNRLGWPTMIDTYRVDFLVPVEVRAGMARVELAVRGIAAPAVEMPVR